MTTLIDYSEPSKPRDPRVPLVHICLSCSWMRVPQTYLKTWRLAVECDL